MGLLSTARADLSSNMITWMIAIVIAIIVMVWFVRNNPFGITKQADSMNEDLMKINEHLSRACNRHEYRALYNPITESGTADFSMSDVCIMANESGRMLRRCEPLACSISEPARLDLSRLTNIVILKKEMIAIGYE